MRTIVMDGNFKAEHLRNRPSLDNIALENGLGYLVDRKPYLKYIKTAVDSPPVRENNRLVKMI